MTYSNHFGTTSITSFHSNERQRVKGRSFFGFKNGAYKSQVKYDSSNVTPSTTINTPQTSNRSMGTVVKEVLHVYLAGTISILAATGLIALIG